MNRTPSFCVFFLFILIFHGYSQGNSVAEIRASINSRIIEMGYIELEPKFPRPIGNALIACVYDYTTTTPVDKTLSYVQESDSLFKMKELVEKYKTILLANSSASIFRDYHLYLKDSILYYNICNLSQDSLIMLDVLYRENIKPQFITAVIKNYPEYKLSVLDESAPNSYHYEEPKSDLNWLLTEDSLSVCGYMCHRAEVNYGGREWSVWYTPEIPISDGPWKLHGLPGLILKATDKSGIHSFQALAIQSSNFPIYLKPHPASFLVKRKEFLDIKKRLESADKPRESIPQELIRLYGFSRSNYGSVNGRQVLKNRVCIYEPLELE